MSGQWFVFRDQSKTGPFTTSQLRQFAKDGQLLPSDLIWKEGLSSPVLCSKVKELFAQVVSTSPSSSSAACPPVISPPPLIRSAYAVDEKQPTTQIAGSSFLERAKAGAGNLASKAKAAAQLAAKRTMKVKIAQMDLPSAYQALGKHLYSEGNIRAKFAKECQAINGLLQQISSINAAAIAKVAPQSVGEKAKSFASAAKDMAEVKSIQLRLNNAYGELGKAVYDDGQEHAGPESLVRPITDSLQRIKNLDAEIYALESAHKGGWITPKRIM